MPVMPRLNLAAALGGPVRAPAPAKPPAPVIQEETKEPLVMDTFKAQTNALLGGPEFSKATEDEKVEMIGDLIYPYVEQIAGEEYVESQKLLSDFSLFIF